MSTPVILWKLSLKAPPERVYAALATNEGRRSFWALEAGERDCAIHFSFPNGVEESSRIVETTPPSAFEIVYFGARTRFDIIDDDDGGCILTLTAEGVPEQEWNEVHAGWVAVLLALKGRVDFGIDLRNGDPSRSWDECFVDP